MCYLLLYELRIIFQIEPQQLICLLSQLWIKSKICRSLLRLVFCPFQFLCSWFWILFLDRSISLSCCFSQSFLSVPRTTCKFGLCSSWCVQWCTRTCHPRHSQVVHTCWSIQEGCPLVVLSSFRISKLRDLDLGFLCSMRILIISHLKQMEFR